MFASNFWASWMFVTNIRNTLELTGFIFFICILINMVGHAGSAAELDIALQNREQFAYWRLLVHFTEIMMAVAVVLKCPRARSWMGVNFLIYILPSIVCYMVFIILPYRADFKEIDETTRRTICKTLYGCLTFLTWNIHVIIRLLLAFDVCRFPSFSVSFYMMRLEEVTVILLGETFIAVVTMTSGVHDTDIRICGVICLTLVFFSGSWYFAAQPHEAANHPISQGAARAAFSFFLSRALGLTALFFGCYVKTLLYWMKHERALRGHSSSLVGNQSSSDSETSSRSSHGSASSSHATTAADSVSIHGSGVSLSVTAVHQLLACYILLMMIINTDRKSVV